MPWLWTFYNSFVLYNIVVTVIYIATGKIQKFITGIIESDPGYSDTVPLAEAVLGLFVFNSLLILILVSVGYILVWRVNRRNAWALYALTVFCLLWLALGTYSYYVSFSIPGYQVTMFDHLNYVIGSLFLIVIFVRPYIGWNRKDLAT